MRAYEPFVSIPTNDSYACLRLNSRDSLAPICNRCDNTKARFAKPRQRKNSLPPEGELKGAYYKKNAIFAAVNFNCKNGREKI